MFNEKYWGHLLYRETLLNTFRLYTPVVIKMNW